MWPMGLLFLVAFDRLALFVYDFDFFGTKYNTDKLRNDILALVPHYKLLTE